MSSARIGRIGELSWRFRGVMLVAYVAWGTAIGVGFAKLWRYTYTPGVEAVASPSWPAGARLQRDVDRPTLVLIVSPGCPCSQATVRELARVVARAPARAAIRMIFDASDASDAFDAGDAGEARVPPHESRLWRMANAIPGVVTVVDRDGSETAAFGAHVSGQAFLYDEAGRLQFRGGITAARGHGGDNDGADSLVALLTGDVAPREHTAVFGCALERAPSRDDVMP
jgi:hypothetical protein